MSEMAERANLPDRFFRELMDYCSNNKKIEKVILFGSRARGDHRIQSDIDLAFYTADMTHSEQNLIEYRIQEIPTYLKIDVLFMDRLTKKNLIWNIEKEGVILYEQGKALRKA